MNNILIIEQNESKFAFRIPSKAIRYRANCHGSFGMFVSGDLGKMQAIDAKEAGLTYGKYAELAIASLSNKILTFEPHYINQQFLEVWGFPVSGEMHSRHCKQNSSELVTFLLHRQSMDKFSSILAEIEREADNAWIDAGMPKNMNEFLAAKKTELLTSSIFRFEFTPEEGKYGIYHWVKVTRKPAESDLSKAALQCSSQILALKQSDASICTDPRIEENHAHTLALSGSSNQPALEPAPSTKNKR